MTTINTRAPSTPPTIFSTFFAMILLRCFRAYNEQSNLHNDHLHREQDICYHFTASMILVFLFCFPHLAHFDSAMKLQ